MTLEAWVNPSTVDTSWRDVDLQGQRQLLPRGAHPTNASRPDAGMIAGGIYADAYGTAALAANAWSLPRRDLRRRQPSASTSTALRSPRGPTGSIAPRPTPSDRRRHHLRPVLRRPDRRGPRLQRRAHRRADPDRPGDAAVGASSRPPRNADRERGQRQRGRPRLGRLQRRSGVTGYQLERCQGSGCSNFAQIATPDRHDATRTRGRQPSTSYSYRVRASDSSRRRSGAYSNVATASTSVHRLPRATAVLTFTRTAQFTAQAPAAAGATWSVDGVAGGNASVGTITAGRPLHASEQRRHPHRSPQPPGLKLQARPST